MKFYKLIGLDNTYIGVASSENFVEYIKKSGMFLTAGEQDGQFIDFKGTLYRDHWMNFVPDMSIQFTEARIFEIDEEEYNTLREIAEEAQENEEYIPDYTPYIPDDSEPGDMPDHDEMDDIDEIVLKVSKELKIKGMSNACRVIIEDGFDLVLRGETYHFSLTTQDQLNLMNLSIAVETQELIPYHADGEECTFYTAEEIKQIIAAATSFKNYQLAYYNALKAYINALDNVDDIAAITYGTPIPDEYKSDVLRVLE